MFKWNRFWRYQTCTTLCNCTIITILKFRLFANYNLNIFLSTTLYCHCWSNQPCFFEPKREKPYLAIIKHQHKVGKFLATHKTKRMSPKNIQINTDRHILHWRKVNLMSVLNSSSGQQVSWHERLEWMGKVHCCWFVSIYVANLVISSPEITTLALSLLQFGDGILLRYESP